MPVLSPSPAPAASLAGRRILVADDDPVCRGLAADILRGAGARVEVASGGRPAVLAVASAVPDLVVTDLDMPEVDGLTLAGILRWDLGLTELPVVVVSAGIPEPARLLAAGVNACLGKPLADGELLAATAGCLDPGHTGLAPDGLPGPDDNVDFDAPDALARMGGRAELLQRLVEVFAGKHGDADLRIAAALSRDDRREARRICHALRGTGASLGARRLQRAAGACEEIIEGDGNAGPALAELRTILAAALAAMAAWRA